MPIEPHSDEIPADQTESAESHQTTTTASTRIALAVEYDGSAFSGWQKQSAPELPTVQASLEAALSKVANHSVSVTCAGRTDSGVHACCQVVHFDCEIDRGEKAWTRGVNSLLPATVRVLWARAVNKEFHARFSALARRYQYVFYRRRSASAILHGKVTPLRQDLDLAALNSASQYLLGEQNFSVFRAAGCQSRSPFRHIDLAHWRDEGAFLVFEIQANAFLQHMVRNIVGSLQQVGSGLQAPDWIGELITSEDRTLAAATAPPEGLYLSGVDYGAEWGLPETRYSVPFLSA